MAENTLLRLLKKTEALYGKKRAALSETLWPERVSGPAGGADGTGGSSLRSLV